ncbi:MAG: rRNA large subunit methyltransferase I, partial [Acetatifactor sp.]|nr:rRNA large subunit methyltransferase I [Acetatifactor sp.]
MSDAVVVLKKGEGRTLKAGGMWVYDNEIDTITGSFEDGDIVAVHDFDDYFMGYGYINTKSKITVRLLSRKKDAVIDETFMEKRVLAEWNYSKETNDTSRCRVS